MDHAGCPREYVREHVRLTLQPFDAPARRRRACARSSTSSAREELLLFSTDYPHWPRDERPTRCRRAARRRWRAHDPVRERPRVLRLSEARSPGARRTVIDCDIHNAPTSGRRRCIDCDIRGPGAIGASAQRRTSPRPGAQIPRDARRPLATGATTRAPAARRAHRRLAAERQAARVRPRRSCASSCSTPGTSSTASSNPLLGAGEQLNHELARRAGHGDQRVAGRRVARARAAPARLDHRPYEDAELAAAEIDRARGRPALRPGAAARPHRRAAGPAQVLADLRGRRASTTCRSASTSAARRRTPITGAGFGPRTTSRTTSGCPSVPGAGDQPRLRGRLRALPEAARSC